MSEWRDLSESKLSGQVQDIQKKGEAAVKELTESLGKDLKALAGMIRMQAKLRGVEIPKEVEEQLGRMGC